jgi:hypothetical protein
MKERIFMNQDNIVKVILKKNLKNQDVLEFNFFKIQHIILTSENANNLKNFFEILLLELSKKPFILELVIEKDYETVLYKDVAMAYIDSLNDEIIELIDSEEWKEVFKSN